MYPVFDSFVDCVSFANAFVCSVYMTWHGNGEIVAALPDPASETDEMSEVRELEGRLVL